MSIVDETSLIDCVEFGLFDPDILKRYSTVHVEKPHSYENGVSLPGGLADPLMGITSRDQQCASCSMDLKECPGHFGHIELGKPIVHAGYSTYIHKILQCVCFHCGRLLVSYSNPELQRIVIKHQGKRRLQEIHELIGKKKNICKHQVVDQKKGVESDRPDEVLNPKFWEIVNGKGKWTLQQREPREPCGKQNPEIEMDPQLTFRMKSTTQPISGEKILSIFERISDQDVRILGFNPEKAHVKWMILTVLPVPPLPVRPAVMAPGSNHPSQDDATHHLSTIVQVNNQLKNAINENSTQTVIDEIVNMLQYQITTFFINDKNSIPRNTLKSGRPIRTISARLKDKRGHLRGNLSGKRVDFSARSVITPDPSIGIDQVGVPLDLSKILTFPEVVTTYNINELNQCVINGPDQLGGANAIITPQGFKFSLRSTHNITSNKLEVGCIVERHLKDDDLVLFNRQPSLHKMSMMGHRAALMAGKTFRLNLSVTTPYNADFDGDEMNLHLPQTQKARAELAHLMLVPFQIISAQGNSPAIGLVQDTLLGSRLLSLRDTFLTRPEMMNLMVWITGYQRRPLPPPAILKPKMLWTGKQVFSLFLPEIHLDAFSSFHDPSNRSWNPLDDSRVIIRKGQLLCGVLDKNTLARREKSLIHVAFNSYSISTARDFINQAQLMINNWLESRGFSIGILDCLTYDPVLEEVESKFKDTKKNADELINKTLRGKLEPEPGMSLYQTFEANINTILNNFIGISSSIVKKHTRQENSLLQMVSAGSKGGDINISQVIACVGQQNVESKRIRFGFRGRTLPHYTKDNLGLESRGFCRNSYLHGLNPMEFFFHTMGGRVGIIDTACKTADVGYIQRRMVKTMESLHVAHDGTIRNSANEILEFLYGHDGIDPVSLETLKVGLLSISDQQFDQMYEMDVDSPNFGIGVLEPLIIDQVRSNSRAKTILKQETDQLRDFRELLRKFIFPSGKQDQVTVPVNIERIIETAKQSNNINEHTSISNLDPIKIIQRVKETVNNLSVVNGNDPISKKFNANATLLLRITLFSNLSSKQAIFKHRLSETAFTYVLGEIETVFFRAIASPGEMVGCLAGQFIGEPITQMNLNTFHYAGVSSKDVTSGLPRINEIMNVARFIKTPRLTIYLEDEAANDLQLTRDVQSSIQHASFKDIVQQSEIFYDPYPITKPVLPEDSEWERLDYDANGYDEKQFSPWVIRFELDKKGLEMIAMTMPDIKQKIINLLDNLFITHTQDYDEIPVMRIRIMSDSQENPESNRQYNDHYELLTMLEQHLYKELSLKGIKGISRVAVETDAYRLVVDPDTGAFVDSRNSPCKRNENVLYTAGSAFLQILTHERVDPQRTVTNHIREINEVLGIEAGRNAILNELASAFGKTGATVNKHHLFVLSETMCFYGEMRPMTRYGIGKGLYGPMMKASFEKAVDTVFEAAAFNVADHIIDMTSLILVGRPSRGGTGMCDVYVHEEMLPAQTQADFQIKGNKFLSQVSPLQTLSPGQQHTSIGDGTTSEPITYYYSPISTEGAQSPITATSPSGYNDDFGYQQKSLHYSINSPVLSPQISPRISVQSPLLSPGISTSYNRSMPSPSAYPASSYGNISYGLQSPSLALNSPGFVMNSPGLTMNSPSLVMNSPSLAMNSPGLAMNSPGLMRAQSSSIQAPTIAMPSPSASSPHMVQPSYYSYHPQASHYGPPFSGLRARASIASPYGGNAPMSPYSIASPGASPGRDDNPRPSTYSPEGGPDSYMAPASPKKYMPE